MATRINIKPTGVVMAVSNLAGAVKEATIKALRDSGMYGLAVIQATIAETKQRPIASGTYRQAWSRILTPEGARLANSARHALFVEVGRAPGPVPLAPILEWVRLKRLGKGVAIPKPKKWQRGAKGPRMPVKAQRELAFAKLVAWKIRHKGFKGRHILLRSMKKIQKYAKKQIRFEVAKVMQNPPRK